MWEAISILTSNKLTKPLNITWFNQTVFLLRLYLASLISALLDNRGKRGLGGTILETNLLQVAFLRSRREVKPDMDRAS